MWDYVYTDVLALLVLEFDDGNGDQTGGGYFYVVGLSNVMAGIRANEGEKSRTILLFPRYSVQKSCVCCVCCQDRDVTNLIHEWITQKLFNLDISPSCARRFRDKSLNFSAPPLIWLVRLL